MIPYSIVRLREAPYDGSAPTLLYAYGGSQGSQWPSAGLLGAAVLEVPDLDMLRYTVLNGYEHTQELGSYVYLVRRLSDRPAR